MALVFAVMHFYTFFKFLLLLSIPFILFFKSGINKSMEWSVRYQRVLASCAFLTRAIPKGLILRKKNGLMFLYVFCTFVSGLILLFWDNLWFDDLRAK